MMSDSSGGDLSDIDDFDDLEMIMQQVQAEQKEEEEEAERVSHRNYIYRERIEAEERLKADYFGPNPKYPLYYFRKRYRMSRELFLEIVSGIENYIQTHHPLPPHFDFFRVRPDATGLPGFSVIMKCTCAIRQLAYDVTPDSLDEYLQMGNHCARDCLDFFTMVASANNDLTVLNNSLLFDDLLDDIAPVAPFECNGVTFEKWYYLADDIYPQWSSFVKSFTVANSEKNALFKRKQKSAPKDVERAFGVLQGRWPIICQLARAWTVNKLRRVMYTCIILHNMILKDQKFTLSEFEQQNYICPQPNILRTWVERCEVQRRKSKELRDKQTHAKLQRNVIEHLWQQHQQHQQQD
ncbi:ALP1-like protein isoform X1 [Tanacetum coccineum]